jgi:hypothetical protein
LPQTNIGVKRRVWIGLVVACAGVGAWVTWNRIHPIVPNREAKRTKPFVQLAGAGAVAGDRILREKAELFDPTPLFFPTEWNYGQRTLREGSQKQPGQVFGSFEPKLTVGEQNIANYGAEAAIVPEKLVDVLVLGNEAPFAGMGQIDAPRSSLPVRSGYLEIREYKNGEAIISQQLSGITPPRNDFAPVEFLVVVGTAGLIGEPILTSGSGWDEVDGFFRTYLVKSYRLGERLRPGQYRVLVGA